MIINLTWHSIKVKLISWWYKIIEPSGSIRLWYSTLDLEPIDWVRITKTVYSSWVSLPEKKDWVIYVVSKIVCEQYRDRDDIYIVNEKSGSWSKIKADSLSPNPYTNG